jgi:molecular chaperone GrpE
MSDEQAVDTHTPTDGQGTPGDIAPGDIANAELALQSYADPATPGSGELDGIEPGGASGLAGQLEAVAAQRDEYLALAQRTQADFENYRKRVARDAAAAELRGVSRLARELLPALDNLDRALAAAGEGSDQLLLDGLRLTQRELRVALERVGIESYGAPGEQFDPEVHEAVAQQPCEGVPPGQVTEVFQVGYRLAGGGILRPARVMVAG